MSTLYELPLTTLAGEPACLGDFAGKVLLIVNVASGCGLTPQYEALEALYRRFNDEGLVVVGFPANDFAGQEPGTDEEIGAFYAASYGVTFPMYSKIAVTGEDQHPLYSLLTSEMPWHESDGTGLREDLDAYLSSKDLVPTLPLPHVLWNFEKFLVGRDGKVVARFAPDVAPESERVVKAVQKALAG